MKNQSQNVSLALGFFLFLVVSVNSFGGVTFLAISHPPPVIEIPFYDFTTIFSAIGSLLFLLIGLIGRFKNLPDLRQKNESDIILAVEDLDGISPPNYFI